VHDLQDVLANLGPEPFDLDLNWWGFYQRLHSIKRHLKPLLLDQSFLAGLGNIYADEALNLAHLHPLKRSNDITAEQAEILLVSIRQVLDEGIRRNGASIDWVYRGGDFQNYFRVYQRTGMPCQSCGTHIERIVIGQRGTHYCPQCQVMN
jgi:formamidopyrimidine-DNA glycosylase